MDWENPFSGTFDFVEIFTWMTTIMEIAVGTWDGKAACGDKWETAEGCNGTRIDIYVNSDGVEACL